MYTVRATLSGPFAASVALVAVLLVGAHVGAPVVPAYALPGGAPVAVSDGGVVAVEGFAAAPLLANLPSPAGHAQSPADPGPSGPSPSAVVAARSQRVEAVACAAQRAIAWRGVPETGLDRCRLLCTYRL